MHIRALEKEQRRRNDNLLKEAHYLGQEITSEILAFHIDLNKSLALSPSQVDTLEAIQIEASRLSIRSVASLAQIGELGCLGGALDVIPALSLSLAVCDSERIEYTLEHAHTAIGYFSLLAIFGYLSPHDVISQFRRSLDMPGHVAWLPGGTQLCGGRLGVMIPCAVGQSLGKRSIYDREAWLIVHCGDAGWISGQALNGFNLASIHGAPISFVMHRNGLQHSGPSSRVLKSDPRKIISAMGVEILEIPSLLETSELYAAYREAYRLARQGRPSLVYPAGFRSSAGTKVTLRTFGENYRILPIVRDYIQNHGISLDQEVWIPGALMSFRDPLGMIQTLLLVNGLPGGENHHDGHMIGRDVSAVLENPLLSTTPKQDHALQKLRQAPRRKVLTKARPKIGTPNLLCPKQHLSSIQLPKAGACVTPREGSDAAYAALARIFPGSVYVISCDLDLSTRLESAKSYLDHRHAFECGVEEQAAALLANGLSVSTSSPQLVVISTFAAFVEGIAREGLDALRYQRNLSGVNEGLNVTYHMSHVGACTGRDHFSGWGLDWINVGLTYLPYLDRFYTPADSGSAFTAVIDLAAHYGGHIIGVPRERLPVLAKQFSDEPLWSPESIWEPVTLYRKHAGAERAILAVGATAHLAEQASEELLRQGDPVDVYIVNGFPLEGKLDEIMRSYPAGVATVEDGLIGTSATGLRGFAALAATAASACNVPVASLGITDPRVAPAAGCYELWEHFGMTPDALVDGVKHLGRPEI